MEYSDDRKKESGDHTMMLMLVGVVAFIVVSAWLAKESDVFIGCWKMLYLPQAKAIAWFSTTFLGELINHLIGHTSGQAAGLVQFIQNTPAHDMTVHFCWEASNFLGKYYLFIFIPFCCHLTLRVYKKTQGESEVYQRFKNAKEFTLFTRKNSLDSHELLDEANKNDKDNEDDKTDNKKDKKFNPETLGNSLSLIDFAKANDLLVKDENDVDQNNWQVDFQRTAECFIKQLGNIFTYIEDLINQPYGWAAIKIIQFIPEKYRAKNLEEISQRHLYDFTILIALLESARKYGVVPSSLFIRLKNDYPSLWYGLNNLGRKVAFVEGAGLSAQYAHEVFQHEHGNKKPELQAIKTAEKSFIETFQIEENH